jgi:hypothetical protein
MHSPTFCAFCILCVAQTMANYKFPPTCLLGTSIGLINVLKGNFSYLNFELQQPLKGSFSYHNIWWVNKDTNGHGFYSVCAFVVIMWSKIPNLLNGECQQPNDKTHFVQKRCTLIPSSSFESPRINRCLTILRYHYAFGLEDERLEDLVIYNV